MPPARSAAPNVVFHGKTYSLPRRDRVPVHPFRRLCAALPRTAPMIVVAIDIGGTFTDLVGFDDEAGRFAEAKSLTTPAELVQGVLDCIRKSGLIAAAIGRRRTISSFIATGRWCRATSRARSTSAS